VTFAARAETPVWRALRQVVRHVADPAELLRDALVDAVGIDAAFVYGSTARGDARPDSDVDLFLVGSLGDTTALAARTMEVSTLLQRDVNVTRYTAAELKDQRCRENPFLERVMAAPRRWVIGSPRVLRRIAA
jgi:predicted nucleotidyltransferase